MRTFGEPTASTALLPVASSETLVQGQTVVDTWVVAFAASADFNLRPKRPTFPDVGRRHADPELPKNGPSGKPLSRCFVGGSESSLRRLYPHRGRRVYVAIAGEAEGGVHRAGRRLMAKRDHVAEAGFSILSQIILWIQDSLGSIYGNDRMVQNTDLSPL